MKKIMVLGAGFPQVQLLNAAKELGYQTVVCSIKGDYPGFSFADEIAYADISNSEEVLESAEKYKVDGVATCCLDTGVQALGYVCDKLGLTGLSEEAAACCADKWMMKKAFIEAGVNTARCFQIQSTKELEEVKSQLEFPVIVKAVDLQGSKGIYICQTETELFEGYQRAMKLTRKEFCIVEEYIEGNELGAQAFVYQGKIVFILPHGDETYMSCTAVPIGHYVPIDAKQEIIDSVTLEAEKAIRAIGLDNCAVNIDLIEKNGKIYVIELTGRAGATCLPELVSIYYGVNYYKMIASMAVGENPLTIFEQREDKKVANSSRMLLSEKAGKVKKIIVPNENDNDVYECSLIIKEGDYVNKFQNAKDRIGQIIVKGDNLLDCTEKMRKVMDSIEIELE